MSLLDLPAVNATLNGLCTLFLLAGFYFIKRKNTEAHRRCMIAAFVTSVLFLISYLTYHTYIGYVLKQGPTVFKNPNAIGFNTECMLMSALICWSKIATRYINDTFCVYNLNISNVYITRFHVSPRFGVKQWNNSLGPCSYITCC